MSMFGKKPTGEQYDYDKETQKPILKCSICNGEQVAGFKNLQTGKFEEIMLIRNESDLREFMERYGVSQISKEY
ncbi:MAG: aspartate dehydrogenase [Lachnospiraceae bacterium]|nr:aspartate dehydrogenase [Lachnospiraceae bacterium]